MAGEGLPLPLGATPPPVAIDQGTLARTKSPSPGPIGLQGGNAGATAAASIAARIVQFAQDRRGRRVGDGECFALADKALRTAGAKSAADFGTVADDTDYVWGTAIALSAVQPGDVVQFRDYKYNRREEKADGGWREHSESRPHHTAIVVSSDGNGLLTVIEQNAPPGSAVRQIQLGFEDGTTRSGSTTIRVTVTGQVWFYRPAPR